MLGTRIDVISNVLETRQNSLQHWVIHNSRSLEEVVQTIVSFRLPACCHLLLAPDHFLSLIKLGVSIIIIGWGRWISSSNQCFCAYMRAKNFIVCQMINKENKQWVFAICELNFIPPSVCDKCCVGNSLCSSLLIAVIWYHIQCWEWLADVVPVTSTNCIKNLTHETLRWMSWDSLYNNSSCVSSA